jgi:hypothetical protein
MNTRSIRVFAALATLIVTGCLAQVTPDDEPEPSPRDSVHAIDSRSQTSIAARLAPPHALSAPAGAHLAYLGGKVIQNVEVIEVLYGSGTYIPQLAATSGVNMASAYRQMVGSGVFDWLSEYNTMAPAQSIGRGSFAGSFQIAPSSFHNGASIVDRSIQVELVSQFSNGNLPAPTDSRVYMVHFPAGKVISDDSGFHSCTDFCAYHATFKDGLQNVYYSVLPDLGPTSGGCATGCGSSTTFNNQTSIASHELVETITDPGPVLAWFDVNSKIGGEIGDLCNSQQGTFVGTDGATYTIQKEFSNQQNDCITTRALTSSVLFYNASSGNSATGQVDSSGTYRGVSGLMQFLAGWTHVVTASNGAVLFYNTSTGQGATARIDGAGNYIGVSGLIQFLAGWTNIAVANKGSVLFYNSLNGDAATARLDDAGNYIGVSAVFKLLPGWTHIVGARNGALLFYDSNSGHGATSILDNVGNYFGISGIMSFLAGWTHIAVGDQGSVLFYNSVNGNAATARLDNAGNYIGVSGIFPFLTGWTQIVGSSSGGVLFYNAANGNAATGRLDSAGNYIGVSGIFPFLPGWTRISGT